MDEEQLDRIDDLFHRARELPGPQRDEFLSRECANDAIRAEVQRLLDQDIAGFLDGGETELAETIGPYRIVRELGRGGMGVVYLAEQVLPVRRRVALKVIQRGLLTRDVLARFETEEQALALMNHSAIARVFDAGVTVEGTPYFAMEYVEGTALVEHCDRERLSIRERLQLFVEVCEGVQHAHQKGIIHRDLKSANVLVAVENGRPVPKIIDFGIAKALGAPLTPEALETQLGQVVGTLDCMSPEQLDWGGQDVDTRSDVYALGVLLYEMLAGARPFDVSVLRRASLDEAVRVLRTQDPPAPSARLASLGDGAVAVARARGTEPRALARAIRGDLDGIVLHALEKERERRYPGASELAADVRRHLADEPVLARSPGAYYRLGRFARRHKAGVGATIVATVALVAGSVAAGVGLVRARAAERVAAAEAERARQEAKTKTEVTKYLVEVFRLAEPDQGQGATITARAILDRQVADIRKSLSDQPGVQGQVMRAMGEAYGGLGLYRTAIPLLEEALPKLEAAHGRDSEVVYDALNELGNLSNLTGAFGAARRYLESALEIADRMHAPEHARATILKNLGDACIKLGDLDAARRYIEAALELQTRLFGARSGAAAKTLSSLAALELEAGNAEAAVGLAERSLAIRIAKYGATDPAVGHGQFALGEADLAAGRFDRARADFEAALPIWESAYGTEHANVGECLFGLARACARLGRRDEAYDYYRRARVITERTFDAGDPRLAGTLADWLVKYAAFLREIGRPDEAAATAAQAAKLGAAPGLISGPDLRACSSSPVCGIRTQRVGLTRLPFACYSPAVRSFAFRVRLLPAPCAWRGVRRTFTPGKRHPFPLPREFAMRTTHQPTVFDDRPGMPGASPRAIGVERRLLGSSPAAYIRAQPVRVFRRTEGGNHGDCLAVDDERDRGFDAGRPGLRRNACAMERNDRQLLRSGEVGRRCRAVRGVRRHASRGDLHGHSWTSRRVRSCPSRSRTTSRSGSGPGSSTTSRAMRALRASSTIREGRSWRRLRASLVRAPALT